MELALAIITLANTLAPGVASLIVLIRKKNGTLAVIPMLDEASAQFEENIKQATEWLKTHPVELEKELTDGNTIVTVNDQR